MPTKVDIVKVMAFPVVMLWCEIWTIKKAKCWRVDAFELWYNKRLLRVPWPAERSSQSVLKEINPEYSLEGLILKLKHQYFGHLIWRAKSLEKIKGKRRRGQQRMRWLDSITNSMDMNLSKLREILEHRGAWRIAVYRIAKDWTRPSDWTTTHCIKQTIAAAVLLYQAGKLALNLYLTRSERIILNLGHQCSLWIYIVVKLPKDFLITRWKWLLRPNVPIAVHGLESRERCVPWGKHPWWLLLPWEIGCSGCRGWKTYNLLSTCWRSRKASGIIQPESGSLRARGLMSEGRKDGHPNSRREKEFAFPSPWAINGWNDTHPYWWGESFIQFTDANTYLFQQHPHRHTQK